MIQDKKQPRYEQLLKPFHAEITVGIHGEDGAKSHDGGLSIAEVAERHEFGLGVPQRSWLRQWFDETRDANLELIKKQFASKRQLKTSANRAALGLEASCKQYIADGTHFEPNSPVTVAKKGSSTPLIDTGALRASIAGKVDVK